MRLKQFRTELIDALDVDQATRERLDELELWELLLHYLSWRDRVVVPRPRQIEVQDGFWSSSLSQKFSSQISLLLGEIEKGADIRPYLSDKIEKFSLPEPHPKKPNATDWRGRDFVLSVYDLHHLHLGERQANNQVKRSDHLLFIGFGRDVARLICVDTHAAFFDGRMTEAAEESVKCAGFSINKVVGLSTSYTADQRASLIRAGVSTMHMLDGKAVFSALININGFSSLTCRWAQMLVDIVEETGSKLHTLVGLSEVASWYGANVVDPSDLVWQLNHCDLWLLHRKYQKAILLLRWRR